MNLEKRKNAVKDAHKKHINTQNRASGTDYVKMGKGTTARRRATETH